MVTHLFARATVRALATVSVVPVCDTPTITLLPPIENSPPDRFVGFEAIILRDNGFRGVVSLDLTGVPAELNGLRQIVVVPDRNRNNASFLITANAVPGRYPITVRATGADVESRTATVDLVIPPP